MIPEGSSYSCFLPRGRSCAAVSRVGATDTPESIEGRIRRGVEELEMVRDYDYVVVNDDLDRCAADLAAIVRAERRRRTRLERA